MRIKLTKKDKAILEYLLTFKVATIYQILRDINGDRAHTYLSERLTYLSHRGFVRKSCYEFKRVYSLGQKGVFYFKNLGRFTMEFKAAYLGYNPHTIVHDLLLSDIYSMLLSSGKISELRTHNDQLIEETHGQHSYNVSDALFKVKKENGSYTLALELETTRKNPNAYDSIFDIYRNNNAIDLVLYLVKTPAQKSELLRFENDVFGDPKSKIFIGLIDDFLENPMKTQFNSCNKKSFCFHTVHGSNKEKAMQDLTFDNA
ncbi:MAG: hypothetical protein HYS98_01065 [Deltaproteobacteria bacterium]|nr:hypothetical protein [Deltaproteobacteria bacterium]